MKDGRIYFIRHSITEAVEKHWMYGSTDLPLTESGYALIEETLKEGIYPSLDGKDIYSSGLTRANQTLNAIYGDVEFKVEPDFREMGIGRFECRFYKDLEDDEDFIRWANDTTGDVVCPGEGGESFNSFGKRVNDAFERLVKSQERDAIVICHGGTISAILFRAFGGNDIYERIPKPARGYAFVIRDGRLADTEPV